MKRPRLVVIPIGPSIAYVPLTCGMYALIDSWKAESVGKWNWHAGLDRKTGKFYARRQQSRGGRKAISMHREILALSQGMEGDHIHGVTLDNRESQLRAVTHLQNSYNKGMRLHNTSGFKGVTQRGDKWRAQIRFSRKYTHLGVFSTPEQAHEAYCKASADLHGEFRRTA